MNLYYKIPLLIALFASLCLAGNPGIKLRNMNIEDENQHLPEYQAVMGGRAELPCNITQHSTEDKVSLILWYREESRAPIYSVDARNSPLDKAKHFPGNMLGSRAYFETKTKPTMLRVEPVQEKDAGIYRCRVDYRWARTFTISLKLNVIVPPKETIIVDDESQELSGIIGPYDEGSDLQLKCEAIGGIPPPAVTWWKATTLLDDSFELQSDGIVRNDLTLTNIQRIELNSVLTCNANNNNVTVAVATSVKLDLNLKPVEARITSARRTMSAARRVELECVASGSRPPARITWWLGTTQLANTTESISPNSNHTTSLLSLYPAAEDNGKYLGCRAENPRLLGKTVEDGWTLNVSYIPKVILSIKTYSKQQVTTEGSDVFFICDVKANPLVTSIGWLFEDRPLHHNPSFGVIISNNSLVLKKVQKEHRGRYKCFAMNMEGKGVSEPVYLKIMYSPICKMNQKIVYGVAKVDTARVECEVDAEPSDISFRWSFNSSLEQYDILSFTNSGPRSIATFVPRTSTDFGSLYCWARNSVGEQAIPCVFSVISAGPPDPVKNCSVTNYTHDSLTVECEAGFNGGLQQRFLLEVYNQAPDYLQANITSRVSPAFLVVDLPPSTEFILVLYAANVKGRSGSVVLKASTSDAPKGEQGFSMDSINIILGVMIGVVAALVFVAGIAVFIIRMREDDRESGGREGPAREKDEILLKKNLVDPSEHDAKDPDVIPPQNLYCPEMEQSGVVPNMLLPTNDYITGQEDRPTYRMEASQETSYDPIPNKSALYEVGYPGSLQRNHKHRQEVYIDFCPTQSSMAPAHSQYDTTGVPFATLDYHRRAPPPLGATGLEIEEDRRITRRNPMPNPTYHGSREIFTPPRGRRTISTPV